MRVEVADAHVMIPEQQFDPFPVLEMIHPIKPPPLIGVGDDQTGNGVKFDFPNQNKVKGGLVEREKTVDIGIDVLRTNSDSTGIEQGGGDDGGQPVKVGVAMGGGYVHRITSRLTPAEGAQSG